ncbi:MAG TPA: Gfo/Idh/MocA family oxidoreductase [Phycisphaerae bacterium]|nr:Gfo/Idh/MocA family oxidoreductase [Phycisphaerae bacterium]
MRSRKLRVGMIGAGGISHLHCQGWSRLKGCELVAVSDIDRAAAARRAEEFDIPDVEPTAKKLIARRDIDVVDIVVPNRFHRPYAVAALEARKHVYCEKPLAVTRKDVEMMMQAAKAARRKLMAAQHMRFQADTMALKEYITRHPLGRIYYARAWYNRRRQLPVRPGFLRRRLSGGGCCVDVGVHVLDTALHLMDNFSPVSVLGVCGTHLARRPDAWSEWGAYDKKSVDVEDFAAGFVRFADGAALTLECSFMLNQKAAYEPRIDLFGTAAGAKWPDCEIYTTTSRDFVDTKIELRPGDQPHQAAIRAFAEAVCGNRPVPVPPAQTLAVTAVLEGLYRSQRLGREVKL